MTRPAMRVLSGVQPTGHVHIGNYIGAISQFVELQKRADCLFCVVDLHAITLPHEPAELRRDTLSIANMYLAAGIDPEQATIFVQSHVPAHAELAWLLNSIATVGELRRMTQFKDKSKGHSSVSAGLFNYPVLMAADILLYQTTHVPVGDDQKQHLELTRDIAERFNARYGTTFEVPHALIRDVGSRVMALDDPESKMSKSAANAASRIELLDPPDVIRDKLKRAVTDTEREVRFDPVAKPAISNLLTIFSLVTDESIDTLATRYGKTGYAQFKQDLAEALIERLRPIQTRYAELEANPDYSLQVLKRGAERATALAGATLSRVTEKLGFIPKPR